MQAHDEMHIGKEREKKQSRKEIIAKILYSNSKVGCV
jgi:hypothetical protein